MNVLDRKLRRDLWSLKGPVIAIALIIVCGVASFVCMLTCHSGLKESRDAYYRSYRMADLWAPVKKAPRSLARDLERVPGVRRVQARIGFSVTLDLPALTEPASGRIVTLPDQQAPSLNDIHLTRGRWFSDGGNRQVIVANAFAREHGLGVGDSLRVIMNNRKESLQIVGTALSPEFVYIIPAGGGLLPDPKHFTILWMANTFAEAAFDFEDSANEFVASLQQDASVQEVIDEFDRRLDRYGAVGAYARNDQVSHRILDDEIEGLRGVATMVPVIFLGVAAFVLHMLLGRLVRTQRMTIAVFRAFGYGTPSLAAHYLKFALLIALIGCVLGTLIGLAAARSLLLTFAEFYELPVLRFRLEPEVLALGAFISIAAAVLGALSGVRHAAALEPAEAMRPEAPRIFKRTLLERWSWAWARFSFVVRMITRSLARTKKRAVITVTAVALATSIVLFAHFRADSLELLIDFQYNRVDLQDVRVTFHEERGRAALYEIRRLAGVRQAQPELQVPVHLVRGHRSRRLGITGLSADQDLHGLIDTELNHIPLPHHGLLLSRKLAELLDVAVGEEVEVRVLHGKKQHFRVPVENVVDEYFGTSAYASLKQLSRWVDEEEALTGAVLRVDRSRAEELGRELKALPAVSSVVYKETSADNFRKLVADSQLVVQTIITVFAAIIAFGVIYNASRISLAERQRELATLRVLGFTRGEVSGVLFGENLLLAVLAIPPGLVLGMFFGFMLASVFDTDLFRFPVVFTTRSILLTSLQVVAFAFLANLAVRRRVRRLDLVEVLKAKE